MSQMMTVELLKAALPKALQSNATQEFADLVNQLALDPEAGEVVRENFLTYSSVLLDGKFKTEDYLAAVTYASHKLMGYNNQDAYIRTFPGRYQALVARGASPKDISAYVAAYHKNKMVTKILEQATIPAWLLHQDAFNRAVSTQLELMDNAVSEKVRAEAANSLLTHLKQPEAKKVELDVSVRQTGGIADLQATMRELAQRQLDAIEAGMGVAAVARQGLVIDGDITDVPSEPVPVPALPAPVPAPVLHVEPAEVDLPDAFDALLPEPSPEIAGGAPPASLQRASRPTLFPSLFDPETTA